MSNWMKLLLRMMDDEQNIPSPFHNDGILNYKFILHNEKDKHRIGYLLFWCSVTHKSAISGRLGVPKNATYVLSIDFNTLNLPDIKLQQVRF